MKSEDAWRPREEGRLRTREWSMGHAMVAKVPAVTHDVKLIDAELGHA